jgi:PASTA domain
VALPAAPGTILIHMDGAPDGDPGTGQGAIVYDRPADAATFIYSAPQVDEFDLHQTGTVPAGGATTYRFAYAQDYTAAGVAALAAAAAAAFGPPPAQNPGPPTGTVTPPPTVTPPVIAAATCRVPALRGKTLQAAGTALRRAHCRVGRVTRRRSRHVRRGRIIASAPRAHTQHPSGTKVKLTLSRGR